MKLIDSSWSLEPNLQELFELIIQNERRWWMMISSGDLHGASAIPPENIFLIIDHWFLFHANFKND